MIVSALLQWYLGYLTYVRPVIYGAQLCRAVQPDPVQVANVTLALIFGWMMEAFDTFFLSSFVAVGGVYTVFRIFFTLYLSHPRFLGATHIYQTFLDAPVRSCVPVLEAFVATQMAPGGADTCSLQPIATFGRSVMQAGGRFAEVAQQMISTSTDTAVPAAALPRQMAYSVDRTSEVVANNMAFRASSPPSPGATPRITLSAMTAAP